MTDTSQRFGVDLGLGKHQDYQDHYNPELLQPIARQACRQHLPINQFNGVDVWTAYELSWLDKQGKPCVAMAEFSIPATSPNIIESKSFKYYLNSFNQTMIERDDLIATLKRDLSAAAGSEISLTVTSLNDYQQAPMMLDDFTCVDELALERPIYSPDAGLLTARPQGEYQTVNFCSHLLKSNCPVTGQPDWASVWVSAQSTTLSAADFLAYIVSYRNHQDFHENCVEQMYCDIQAACKPRSLWVYARYTRRGGLDINPFRSSKEQPVPLIKAARQ